MSETPETAPAFEPECWCDSAACECPGSPKTPQAAPVPQHLGDGYDAVWAYIAELNDRWPDVTRNAAIWRAVEAFKDAVLPAHEAQLRSTMHHPAVAPQHETGHWGVYCLACSDAAGDYVYPCRVRDGVDWPPQVLADPAAVRKAYHAELFGTPEEIAARAAEPAKPDDIADLCERARPGHHEQRVRVKVAEEMRRMAEGRRFYADGNPPGENRTWLEAEACAFNSAAKVAEGHVETVLALLPSLMWTAAEAALARGEQP